MQAVAPSPTEAIDTRAGPVDTHERLVLLDVLRGFALFGVFFSNVNMWFSGRIFLPPDRGKALTASPVNTVAEYLFGFFVFGKFITIFSFLFGLGFAIQMGRAEDRGASIVPLYCRRLGAMMLIGLTHLFALWYGDVLSFYAVVGLSLLLFRKRSDRSLLFWGFGFAIVAPLLASAAERFLPLLTSSREAVAASAKAATEKFMAERASALAGFESSSYLTAIRANAVYFWEGFFIRPVMLPLTAATLGKFLLGLYAGRRRLFHEPEQNLRLFRRLLIWGLVAGVLGSSIQAVVRYLFVHKMIQGDTPWRLVMHLPQAAGFVGLAMGYVSAITLLFQRPRVRRLLLLLAPAGRMALTNYLAQTVISMLVFYGFGLGLIGKLGPLPCLAITVFVFGIQMITSRIWLSRFRFGPAEWVWRSLTYRRAQPMRLPGERRIDLAVQA
jgi:uncharacterized protein